MIFEPDQARYGGWFSIRTRVPAWKADALPLGDSRVEVYSTVMTSMGQEAGTCLLKQQRAAQVWRAVGDVGLPNSIA